MNRRTLIVGLLLVAIIANTIPRYLNFDLPYDSNQYKVHYWLYSKGQALSYVLILMAGYLRVKDKVIDIVFELTLWLAVSNLMDELFFDPIHLGWNEIVFAILMIIYAVQQYRQYKKYTIDYTREHKF